MTETQKFLGRGHLIDRLTAQMGGNRAGALDVLRKRGQVEKGSEELTAVGRARDVMTAAERAKDRASKAEGKPASAFSYNSQTNTATRRDRFGSR